MDGSQMHNRLHAYHHRAGRQSVSRVNQGCRVWCVGGIDGRENRPMSPPIRQRNVGKQDQRSRKEKKKKKTDRNDHKYKTRQKEIPS